MVQAGWWFLVLIMAELSGIAYFLWLGIQAAIDERRSGGEAAFWATGWLFVASVLLDGFFWGAYANNFMIPGGR